MLLEADSYTRTGFFVRVGDRQEGGAMLSASRWRRFMRPVLGSSGY